MYAYLPGHTTATSHSDEQSVSSRRTLDRRSIITRTACSSSSENEKPAPTRVQATHVRSWQMLFPCTTHVLRLPVLGHIGGAVICVLYFSLLLFAALYRTSIWTNPVRAAYVAISQIPVVYLLATKNNVLGVLLGTAYDKVRRSWRLWLLGRPSTRSQLSLVLTAELLAPLRGTAPGSRC